MKKDPIIVLLDDHADYFERLFTEIISEDSSIDSAAPRLVAFMEDEKAAQFAADNSSKIIGYIQDIFRPDKFGDVTPAGVSFYNLIINQLTPNAKTLFHSGNLHLAGKYFELPIIVGDRIRILSKPASLEDLRYSLRWLSSPIDQDSFTEDSTSSQETFELIELINLPWEEVCQYLTKHPNCLHEMSPRKFEMLIAEVFISHGWEVDLTARTRDGGYDIVAIRRMLPTNLRVLVEAKRWYPNKPIGVQVVRSLYGLRASQSFSQVVLATSTYVSEPAKKEFERVVPWELDFIERDAILDWCKTYSEIKLLGSFSNQKKK